MRALIVCLMLMYGCSVSAEELPVPVLQGRVNDFAALLSPGDKQALETMLADEETATTNQLVILIMPSLGDDVLASFAQRVFESWKIGQAGKDNGILLIIFKDNISVGKNWGRLQVGRGLEGALPDIEATHIVRDTIKPLMQSGRYADGLRAGVEAIQKDIHADFPAQAAQNTSDNDFVKFLALLIGGFFVTCILAAISMVLGGFSGAIFSGWLAALALVSPGLFVFWIVAGFVIGLIIGFLFNGNSSGSWGGSGGSSWSSSGDSWSSSDGGGGFSGGGGDCGGGGGGD